MSEPHVLTGLMTKRAELAACWSIIRPRLGN